MAHHTTASFLNKVNLNMSSALAATVSKIKVPENHLLLGIQPILAMHFQTDDAQVIIKGIRKLTKLQAKNLVRDVTSTIQSSLYPHTQSVWMFNDPNVEIEMLTQAIVNENESATQELQSTIEMHHDTYPFVEVLCEPLIDEEDIISQISIENPIDVEEDKSSGEVEDKGVNALGAFFIPTATLGSLYILSKIAKESEL